MHNIALFYFLKGENENSIAIYERILSEFPGNTYAKTALTTSLIASDMSSRQSGFKPSPALCFSQLLDKLASGIHQGGEARKCELGTRPYYWSAERSSGEVDFIIQRDGEVWLIEVKAAENLRSKSLAAFCKRYDPKSAVRLSLSGHREQDWLRNIPIYAIGSLAGRGGER